MNAVQKRILLTGILLALGIFGLGYYLGPDYHLEFLYSLVVLLTIFVPGNRSTFDASVAMTGLILVGFFLSKDTVATNNRVLFTFFPVLIIWSFTFAIIKYKLSQENLLKSTEHLNAMFRFATEGILISNSKGVIVMANPRACQLFGYDADGLNNRSIEDLVPTRFRDHHAGFRKGYTQDPKNRPMGKGRDLFAKRSDGSEFPVEISLSTFVIKKEMFVISFLIDITERKLQDELIRQANEELEQRVEQRTAELAAANLSLATVNRTLHGEMATRAKVEEALRDSERLFNTIAHNFPDGIICVLDRNLRVVLIDGNALQDLDIPREKLNGKSLQDLQFLQLDDETKEKFRRVFQWETAYVEFSYADQRFALNAVPLPDNKGFVKEILLVIHNVTEIRKAEQEMKASLEKERSLNEMKSRFVSIASHEFRTPLSTILSSISLVDRYHQAGESEKARKHVERIKTSVKNLTEILNDFLSLEKLEAGKVEIHPETINLVRFAEDLCEELQALAKPGQVIHYRHTGEKEDVVSDKQLLRPICINLLNNAIKYSPENSRISFTTDTRNGIQLIVEDQGMGIPLEDQQHLFDQFFRAGNVTAIQGTGLGLNIVRKYARLLGGDIRFTSEVQKGTTFTVNLPETATA